MKLKHLYLLLAILGLILTYSQLPAIMADYGGNIVTMFTIQFSNPTTTFFGFDLLVSALAALVFIIFEGRRLKIKYYWISILCIILVGLAFGFPLFLYMRENKIAKK